jgi:hypothetical protein
MTTATLELRNDALMAIMLETPEYRELVLKAKAIQANAINESYEVKSLGVSMTLAQVAITYQAYKGVPKSLGEGARAYAKSISTECLAIIKKTGYKADWTGVQSLASHA